MICNYIYIYTATYYKTYEMVVCGIAAWNNISFVNLTLKKSFNLDSSTCIKLTRIYKLVCVHMCNMAACISLPTYTHVYVYVYIYIAVAKTKQPISRSHFFTWLPFLLEKQDRNACALTHRYLHVPFFSCMYVHINYIAIYMYMQQSCFNKF